MLEVKNATIIAGGKQLATGLSFIAKDGQLTCITGPEGCGKTTLIRTLLGFLPISEGFVSVDGELLTVSSAHAFRKQMAYLPQQIQQLRHQLMPPTAKAGEVADYAVWNEPGGPAVFQAAPSPTPLSPDEVFQLAEETLKGAADKLIVIADEPAAGLTPELTRRMLQLLRQQAETGKTVLVASRRADLIDGADQVIII